MPARFYTNPHRSLRRGTSRHSGLFFYWELMELAGKRLFRVGRGCSVSKPGWREVQCTDLGSWGEAHGDALPWDCSACSSLPKAA